MVFICRQRVALPDLSAEVRKIGDMPITGDGFCDIWMGERLGKEKVALKVLKMFGVPEQIRRVSAASAAEREGQVHFGLNSIFSALSCRSYYMVPSQTPEHSRLLWDM